jgi:hypothetical protein
MEVEGKEEVICILCARQNCEQLSGSMVPWNRSAGGVGCGARSVQKGKESVETRQRWERHDEGQRGSSSGRDAGGSAAHRVRRLLVNFITL